MTRFTPEWTEHQLNTMAAAVRNLSEADVFGPDAFRITMANYRSAQIRPKPDELGTLAYANPLEVAKFCPRRSWLHEDITSDRLAFTKMMVCALVARMRATISATGPLHGVPTDSLFLGLVGRDLEHSPLQPDELRTPETRRRLVDLWVQPGSGLVLARFNNDQHINFPGDKPQCPHTAEALRRSHLLRGIGRPVAPESMTV